VRAWCPCVTARGAVAHDHGIRRQDLARLVQAMGRTPLGRSVLSRASSSILSWRCVALLAVSPRTTRYAGIRYVSYLDQREVVFALGIDLGLDDRSCSLDGELGSYG